MTSLRTILYAICLPIAGFAADSFVVATIKPTPADFRGRYFRMETANQFAAHGYTLRVLISAAYDLNPKAVSGGPAWIDSDR